MRRQAIGIEPLYLSWPPQGQTNSGVRGHRSCASSSMDGLCLFFHYWPPLGIPAQGICTQYSKDILPMSNHARNGVPPLLWSAFSGRDRSWRAMLGELHIPLPQMGFPVSDISLACQAGHVAPTVPWLAFPGLAMPWCKAVKAVSPFQ